MRIHSYTRYFRLSSAIRLGMFAAVLAWTASAHAQAQPKGQPQPPAKGKPQPAGQAQPQARPQPQYKELPADAKLSQWSDIVAKRSDERLKAVENMLTGASSLDVKPFESFFNSVVFPQFTRAENIFAKRAVRGAPHLKSTVCMLPDMRKVFKSQFLQAATNRQAHDKLNDLTLNAMSVIAADSYHPIARYNAMLLIAELNEDEDRETPYKQALVPMVNAARSTATVDGVRAAAMVGIVRHAKAGIQPNWQASLTPIFKQLATDTKRPPERSQEGHDWIRRRALEALAAMQGQNPPADGSFLQLLDTVLADADSTMELRADAVEVFLTSKFVAPAQFDSAKFAAGIGQVAVDAYHNELETSLRMGRKVYPDGMTYYFRLVDKALAALDKAAPAPSIAKLQSSLADLAASTVLEEPPPDALPDPSLELKLYDEIAKAGADFESLVTGKPVSDILPKRGKVGGNTQAGAVGGYGAVGGGYGRPGGGGGYGAVPRTSSDRSGGYGRVPPPSPSRGGAR
ncbi:MAG: hypothetical protein WD894_22575 [Pirellulales bacterium]